MSELGEDHIGVKDQRNVGSHVLTFDDSDTLLKVVFPGFYLSF